MEQRQISFNEITEATASYLKKMGYSESNIVQFHAAWNHLKVFMVDQHQLYFKASVVEAFIYDMIGMGSFNDLSSWQKQIASRVNVLTEYLETGSVKFRRCKVFRELDGPLKLTMREYISYRKSFGISSSTEDIYRYHLSQFAAYLKQQRVSSIEDLCGQTVMSYADSTGMALPGVRYRNLSILRGFLRFLYDTNAIEVDLSRSVPKCKRVRQPKLPSTYNKDEVESLISSVDRSSPKGKRDYAMILITARLGLRALDVCNLSFNSILWEQNLLSLNQAKTDEAIQLPLLAEIGEAIVDYLKYGRPKSELPYVFLHVNPPYDRLNRSTLHSIICFYMRRAGIGLDGSRKRGPHALRHSLAGVLLEKKTPVPVIAEVLGHQSTESTRLYLRIDMDSLKQCALEVPPIDPGFYGGGRADE